MVSLRLWRVAWHCCLHGRRDDRRHPHCNRSTGSDAALALIQLSAFMRGE